MLLLAATGRCRHVPQSARSRTLDDGSMVLAMERRRRPAARRARRRARSTPSCSTRSWQRGRAAARAAARPPALRAGEHPRRRRAARDDRPGVREESASPRLQAIDRRRAAGVAGRDRRASEAASPRPRGCSRRRDLAGATSRTSSRWRSRPRRAAASKALLRELRREIAAVTGEEPLAARAARPRAPPDADHDHGRASARSTSSCRNWPTSATASPPCARANCAWLAVCVVMSSLTYVASAVGLPAACRDTCRSSQRRGLSRVVVRQPRHAGQRRRHGAQHPLHAEGRESTRRSGRPAWASTCVAGGIVHVGVARAASSRGPARASTSVLRSRRAASCSSSSRCCSPSPASSIATRRGRRLVRIHGSCRFLRSRWPAWSCSRARRRSSPCCSAARWASRSPTSRRSRRRSPRSTAASASPRSARSTSVRRSSRPRHPTPGGLGAIEAALVAGLTGVGMDPAIAVAAVLSYRLATYWLPILPGLDQLPAPGAPQLHLAHRTPLERSDRMGDNHNETRQTLEMPTDDGAVELTRRAVMIAFAVAPACSS